MKGLVPRAQPQTERTPAALFGGKPCNRTFGWLTSAGGVVAEATGAGHLGKITKEQQLTAAAQLNYSSQHHYLIAGKAA